MLEEQMSNVLVAKLFVAENGIGKVSWRGTVELAEKCRPCTSGKQMNKLRLFGGKRH
jgi:hypothetical protein